MKSARAEEPSVLGAGRQEFRVCALDTFLLRAPVPTPVQTSFGMMDSRPSLLLRIQDDMDGVGWGEVWCNFPSMGAEHRAGLLNTYIKPMLIGKVWNRPEQCFDELTRRLEILAIQSGEPGPLRQVVAGVDMAVWDLLARRAGQPLWQFLSGATDAAIEPRVKVYASGLNPTEPEELAGAKYQEGYRAFKLKVGFGDQRDDDNLRAIRDVVGDEAALMADANQAWTLAEAERAGRNMARYDLTWLEEPIRADAPYEHWTQLARRQPIKLAAGENFAGMPQFHAFIAGGAISVVQPDIGKWGGFSYCIRVARDAVAHGKWFCPHWLGGGVGLAAALHLKAAVGGEGCVEVDANENPLRELMTAPFLVYDGYVSLAKQPGLGVVPDLTACKEFLIT